MSNKDISKFGETFISYGTYHYDTVYLSHNIVTKSFTFSVSPSLQLLFWLLLVTFHTELTS